MPAKRAAGGGAVPTAWVVFFIAGVPVPGFMGARWAAGGHAGMQRAVWELRNRGGAVGKPTGGAAGFNLAAAWLCAYARCAVLCVISYFYTN